MPQALLDQMPALYSTQDQQDPILQVKYFFPAFGWTWYGIEFDGQDILFGWVEGDFPELGYFSLRELAEIRDRLGLPFERDLYFKPVPLSAIKK